LRALDMVVTVLVQIAEFPSGTVLFWGAEYGDE
jgi:hypothetical protein